MSKTEFITLMALMMSFVALAIDAILPALNPIANELKFPGANDAQLLISSVFFGMSFGLISFGPFSDSFGRKPAIYIGVGIFTIGCGLAYFATSLEMLLFSRLIQGFGAASARVITMAMIRDRFSGNTMAQIMSLIMMVFILVPALAPLLGLGVLQIGSWRDIFLVMMILSIGCFIWFALRQEETLDESKRIPFSFKAFLSGAKETLSRKVSFPLTVASGVVFGAFVGYLSSTQQILQNLYGLGDKFPFYFGSLALAIGVVSYLNSRLVKRYGMMRMCLFALIGISALSSFFIFISYHYSGVPPLEYLMTFLVLTFFCFGIIMGNINALAIEPLGHIAGTANSVISSLQNLLSVGIGGYIGHMYNQSVNPLVIGFLACSVIALIITYYSSQVTLKE